jgi:hypothetical protein
MAAAFVPRLTEEDVALDLATGSVRDDGEAMKGLIAILLNSLPRKQRPVYRQPSNAAAYFE